MMFSEEIDVGFVTEEKIHGEVVQTVKWTTLCANRISDTRSEFYQGMVAGLKPEISFEIHDFEYEGETLFRYPSGEQGTVYTVIRAPKREDKRELVGTTFQGVLPNG